MEKKIYAFRYVSVLGNKLRREFEKLSFPAAYSGAQGRILHFILTHPDQELYQKDIEEEFCLRPPTATAVLKKMEENQFIRRIPSPHNGKYKQIVLNEKAQQYKAQLFGDLSQLEQRLCKNISEKDLAVWLRVMEQMMQNIG